MTAERQAEYRAHEALRDAIREASNAQWARRIAEGKDEEGTLAETQPEVLGGILVDYVAVAVFDAGQDHTVTVVLRTDGECPQYRTAGLLQHVLADL